MTEDQLNNVHGSPGAGKNVDGAELDNDEADTN